MTENNELNGIKLIRKNTIAQTYIQIGKPRKKYIHRDHKKSLI